MPIPDFQSMMRAGLGGLSDDVVRSLSEIREQVAEQVGVTQAERDVRLPSGTRRFNIRVGWALSHLVAAGAVSRPSRANYQITPRGRLLLSDNPQRIDLG